MKRFLHHRFQRGERDPRYCGYMIPTIKHSTYGTVSMETECGYPPDAHPTAEEDNETE